MTRGLVILLLIVCALPAAASRCLASPPSAVADPHAQLEQILRQPAYNAWRLREQANLPDIDAHVPTKWTDKIKAGFHAIGDFFDWLFRSRSRTGTVGARLNSESLTTVLKLCAWVIVGAIAIFLGIVLIRVLGGSAPRNAVAHVLSREQVQRAMESGDALAMNTAAWMDEARRLADEQNFRAVYRAMYLALLSGLHAAGKIDHHRNRTNWIYVERYRGPQPERQRFSELTELFDRVWYGRKPAEGADLQQLRVDIDALTRVGAA